MKEYGTSIQKLADYLKSISDLEQRTQYAHVLVELMRQIHPSMRVGEDYTKKLWDDLYVMCDFDLEVDSPYPPPPKEILGKKPEKVAYSQTKAKYKFYGRNVEYLILKAMLTEDPEERRAFVSYILRLMKAFYISWNKDNPEMSDIFDHMTRLSNGKLQEEIDYIKANGLVESSPKDNNVRFQKQPQSSESKLNLGHRNFKNNRNNNYSRNNNNSNNNNNNNNNRNNFQKRRPQ